MSTARRSLRSPEGAQVVDLDEALLHGCPDDERRDLETEADLLTTAFADGRSRSLDEMAWTLTRTAPPRARGGLRARRLAAVLRLRAKAAA